MPAEENKRILEQSLQQFNATDLDGYLRVFNPSVLHHGFSRHIGPGVSGLRSFYRQLMEAFPDGRIETEDLVAEGEKLAHRYNFYGTHRSEYLGFAPTMKLVMFSGQVLHHFQQGQSVEVWSAADALGLLAQLGAPNPFARPK